MASNSNYNALIKSLPDSNVQSIVTGKVLLTNLNLLPSKWTMLFRGKYLSRDVNMEKLLCSSKDPIIVYKGIVKPPSLLFNVHIDCSEVTQSEENQNIVFEVEALENVEHLRWRVATKLGKKIQLIYNDRVLQNYESLQDCKIVKDGTKISAKIQTNLNNGTSQKVYSEQLISKTFKVCLGGNKEGDKDKMAFFGIGKVLKKRKGGKRRQMKTKSGDIILEAKNSDTVDILKQRICAAFNVNPTKHGILMNDEKLKKWEELQNKKFQEGDTIELEEDNEEELNQRREEELERRREARKNGIKLTPEEKKILAKAKRDKEREWGEECKKEAERKQEKWWAKFNRETERRKEWKRKRKERRATLRKRPWHEIKSVRGYSISEGEIKLKEALERRERKKVEQERRKQEDERRRQEQLEKRMKFEKEMESWSEEKKLEWRVGEEKKKAEQEKWQRRFKHGCTGGGGSFPAQDVERIAKSWNGETPTHTWNSYSFGMTLYGDCSNAECVSKTTKVKNENGVSHIAGYGNIILTVERIKFPCSACNEMFPLKEFVLCGGRALFRFKKSGVGEPVKTVVIESEYNILKYATFGEEKKGKKVKMSSYDFIEITTVKPWCGLYTCVGCDGLIRFKQDENVLRCGHAYHNECTPVNVGRGMGDGVDSDSIVGCHACDAGQLQSVYDMLGIDTGNSASDAALVEPL